MSTIFQRSLSSNQLFKKFINTFKKSVTFVLLSGCLTPTEIATDLQGEKIIISGQISNLSEQSVIHIGKTADIERLPFPVSGGIVNLFEGNSIVGAYIEDQSTPGKYVLSDYIGNPGKMYHIKVQLQDNRLFKSVPEKMPDDSGMISSYYEIEKNYEYIDNEGILVSQPVVKIFGNSVLPESTNRYIRWTVEEVFMILGGAAGPVTPAPCFVTQLADPQSIILLDRQYLFANEFPDQLLAIRPVDYSFMLRHYFVTYQTTLTEEAYDYWRKVKILVEQSGGLFDTPPASISGNILNVSDSSQKVYGYFEATHQTLTRFPLTREDFPFTLTYNYCVYTSPPTSAPPLRCLDCLSVRNSSYNRPPWF